MNYVNLIGRLTKDLEIKKSKGDKEFVGFTLAVEDFYNGEKLTHFVPCIAWGKLATNLVKYTCKGSQIALEGKVSVRNENKDEQITTIVTIVSRNIKFLDNKLKDGSNLDKPMDVEYNDPLGISKDELASMLDETKTNKDSILWED